MQEKPEQLEKGEASILKKDAWKIVDHKKPTSSESPTPTSQPQVRAGELIPKIKKLMPDSDLPEPLKEIIREASRKHSRQRIEEAEKALADFRAAHGRFEHSEDPKDRGAFRQKKAWMEEEIAFLKKHFGKDLETPS